METQSITLAVYLWQAGRSNLNLKPSSFDCFIATWADRFAAWSVARAGVLKKAQRQGSLGSGGVETLRSTQATTWTSLTLAGLPLLPGEQQELFTEPIISSATQSQT